VNLIVVIAVMDAVIVAYMAVFFTVNMSFIALSFGTIRRDLQTQLLRPADADEDNSFLPLISLLVPAYNEEVTIVESVRSLLRLKYPRFEIIICNDGSKDRTVEVLIKAFRFMRTDMEVSAEFGTATVRGYYDARSPLPPGLERLILVDKENGGKADALNAAINAAHGAFVTSMDADSLLQPDALLFAARPIIDDPTGIVAVGAQVGLSNGATVEDGRVVEVDVPATWIARFQIVEYMRSFCQGRVALSRLNSLLVLSGVFALLRRDVLVAMGGFLTPLMRARVGLEYCGADAHTVCEDMEVVVRLHRYLLDRGLPGRVVLLPFPLAWTEAPELYESLGKQRSRWYRGLLEVLGHHRAMLFRRRFRQIGLFSLPYQLLFEALAPIMEAAGYLLCIASLALGILSPRALVTFLALAMAMNLCISTFSIYLGVFTERASRFHTKRIALFPYAGLRQLSLLVFTSLVSNFGYRQYLVYWKLRGCRDYLKKKRSWDKFARKGFATARP
jgi:cellulose synthase/poly-beta-1,6-N-acetylglucosamine synthase-like glycosyltransferase